MLAVRLPDESEHRLTDLAKKTGRTKSFYAHKKTGIDPTARC